MEDRNFHDRFEKANSRVAKRLKKKIQADVDQRKFEEGKPLCFMLFHCYSVLLIPLDRYPDEFRHLYSDAVFDLDMKDDLERSKVINWCRTIKQLYPIKTTADGNCLANAVSLALWGIEDSDAFLRRLLYVTMTTDPKGRFKRRWLNQQRTNTDDIALGLRLNTEQYTNEWDAVIRATTDIVSVGNQGMPYTFLEAIHLYILANILRRPIILVADNRARNLLGESMQESDIGGIYLPLEWKPEECQKNPIVIGYNMNHFAPLVGQEDINKDNTINGYACPLVTHDFQSLKVHFTLPGEESEVLYFMTRYLKIEEVVNTTNDGGVKNILCARLTYCSLPDDLNIIQEHRKDCERKFRLQIDEEAGQRPQVGQSRIPVNPQAFQFQVLPPANINVVPNTQRKQETVKVVQPRPVVSKRKKCTVLGCKMYGNPETNGLCSKCFNDFTVQYAEDEAASRKRTQKRNILQPVIEPAPMYNDLSIMGENCQTGCGFRCSTETYPFCHECYPKFAHLPQQRTAEAQPVVQESELSIMPQDCQEPNCTYRASRLTFPYCHQCFDKHLPKAQPTAPPVSVSQENIPATPEAAQPMETGDELNLQLRIQEEPETNVIEIRQPPGLGLSQSLPRNGTEIGHLPGDTGVLQRKCKTGGCLNSAIRGNDGYCDKCYDQSLFGTGDMEANVDITSNTKPTLICRTPNCNGTLASGCDQCLECFLKDGKLPSTPMNETRPMQISSQAVRDRDLTVPLRPVAAELIFVPSPESTKQDRSDTHRKYICAKAGCDGIRMNNKTGLCYDCFKVANENRDNPVQEPNNLNKKSNLNMSDPFVSRTPNSLSEEEKRNMYPIVTSSKQKVKCAAAICNNMIYPPSKLCDDCTAAIEKSHAEKLKSGELRQTAPIVSSRSNELIKQRHTVPIAKQPSKLCIEKDCERFGDPAQMDRCSRHYNLARQRFKQPSPPLSRHQIIKQLSGDASPTTSRVTNTTFVPNVPVQKAPVPVENGDELTAALNRIENTRKSRSRCKNNSRTGCNNYGNPSKSGFCNQCFDNHSVQALIGHPRLPGLNQID